MERAFARKLRRRILAFAACAGAFAIACNGLLGNEERFVDDRKDASRTRDGTSPDGDETDEGGTPKPCTSDLKTDQKHCGACGHDCLGGTCNDGKCQPFVIATAQTQPSHLVIESGVAFWTNQTGTVHRCEVAGCNGQPKYISGIDAGNALPTGLAVVGSDLFMLGYYSMAVDRCAITGCAVPSRIAQNLDYPNGLGADATGIYVKSANGGWFAKCALPDCAGGVTRIATRTTAGEVWQGFAMDEDYVYAIGGPNNTFDAAFLWRASKTQVNGQPERIGQDIVRPYSLVASGKAKGSYLYFIENGKTISRIAQTPGLFRTYFGHPDTEVGNLAVDDKYLYWTTGSGNVPPGAIRRCLLAGCPSTVETVVEKQNQPTSLVVTDKAIYWVEYGGGTVKGLAK
jgi:hypothetical protein